MVWECEKACGPTEAQYWSPEVCACRASWPEPALWDHRPGGVPASCPYEA